LGYDVREAAERSVVNQMALTSEDPWAREKLGYLAWMVAHGYLDVELAVPLDEDGQVRAGLGLYHAKMGIVTDAHGDQLVFKGSINETPSGWRNNCESFDVNCSWNDESDRRRVEKSTAEFAKLWAGKAHSAKVLPFPDAVREKLLAYLPNNDTFVAPPKRGSDGNEADGAEHGEDQFGEDEKVEELSPEERRRQTWTFIRDAPARPDGALVSVETSAVKPWPHQLRAYKRMLDNWPFRLLIADEVGLGKTIEAGMILRHAWISGQAKRILIMTPASVLKQWQRELYEKFNLLVPVYTGQHLEWPDHHGRAGDLKETVSRQEWTNQPFVLVSSHLMRRRDRQPELADAQDWDLLVLDEAHHARRRSPGTPQEGGPNRLLSLMQKIQHKASSMLFMTATPMQVHPVELWDLLSVLGLPDPWSRQNFLDYFDQLAKNPDEKKLHHLCRLFQATEQAFGETPASEIDRIGRAYGIERRVKQRKVVRALRETSSTIPLRQLDNTQRRMARALLRSISPVHYRMSRHTRQLLREYYKAGMLDSPVADRDPRDVPVDMTDQERAIYDAVETYISDTYEKAAQDDRNAVGFVMTIYRRRLASSFEALRQTLTDRLAALSEQKKPDTEWVAEDLPQDEVSAEVVGEDEAEDLEARALKGEEREEIQALLKDIAKLGTDSKALKLVELLQQAEHDGYRSMIVFTQYTDTLDFLKGFLADRINIPVGCYSGRGGETQNSSGQWGACSKEQIKRMLRERKVRLLICTDAAGEGLNLQTCGVLVNYDLPWNPMKVEQRIGRVDRIGQEHSELRIINLGYADTVETDVYFALSDRIDLFQGMVGKLQPILSRLPKEFEAATLEGNKASSQSRQEAVHHIHGMVDEAEASAFDIDEVSEADLTSPEFPKPPLTMRDIEDMLQTRELLPPGVECEELDRATYSLRCPGERNATRITVSTDLFEDHFEGHQLFIYDSPAFRRVLSLAEVGGIPSASFAGRDLAASDREGESQSSSG
jgi:SNF2 family DNA or RNA helicase